MWYLRGNMGNLPWQFVRLQEGGPLYGCFPKWWWYPQNTPKWSFLVGKPTVVGYDHLRNLHMYAAEEAASMRSNNLGFQGGGGAFGRSSRPEWRESSKWGWHLIWDPENTTETENWRFYPATLKWYPFHPCFGGFSPPWISSFWPHFFQGFLGTHFEGYLPGVPSQFHWENGFMPIGSMGRTVYLPTWLVDFWWFSRRWIYYTIHGSYGMEAKCPSSVSQVMNDTLIIIWEYDWICRA